MTNGERMAKVFSAEPQQTQTVQDAPKPKGLTVQVSADTSQIDRAIDKAKTLQTLVADLKREINSLDLKITVNGKTLTNEPPKTEIKVGTPKPFNTILREMSQRGY